MSYHEAYAEQRIKKIIRTLVDNDFNMSKTCRQLMMTQYQFYNLIPKGRKKQIELAKQLGILEDV